MQLKYKYHLIYPLTSCSTNVYYNGQSKNKPCFKSSIDIKAIDEINNPKAPHAQHTKRQNNIVKLLCLIPHNNLTCHNIYVQYQSPNQREYQISTHHKIFIDTIVLQKECSDQVEKSSDSKQHQTVAIKNCEIGSQGYVQLQKDPENRKDSDSYP